MSRAIYALLVGIDKYPAPVPRLRGCVNDIREMRQYLEARINALDTGVHDVLKIEALENEQATRDAVIRAIREHLGQAGPEDVALFCYSGHGSQEQAPEEFWRIEPDRLDETLVLYDSRTEGSWDLADKELAELISEVAGRGAHVVVLLDCCHSGSGTRAPNLAGTAIRRAPTDLRQRPLGTFILDSSELSAATSSRRLPIHRSGWYITGRHVLLAACRDNEEAKEYQGGGKIHGAFSYFLGETLCTIGGDITYRDLFARATALLRGQVQRQSPQLEATVSEDLDRPFLGGAIRRSPRYFVASVQGGRWMIDAGKFHGISASTSDAHVELALFAYAAADEDLKDPHKALTTAKLTRVLAASSLIELDRPVDAGAAPLKAIITHLPTPRLRVILEGESQGVALARRALVSSLFVREPATAESPDYRLIARSGQYLIVKPDDDRPLIEQIDGYSDEQARRVIERLEHIERWKTTAELNNPCTSIQENDVQVEILYDGKPLTGSEIHLEYSRTEGNEWVNPEVTIRLTNTGKRTLYVGLLDLPQTFGIYNILPHVGCQKLDKDQSTFANDGDPIPVTVPDEFWERGVTEIKDVVKVIVSTNSFDARRLTQKDLDVPRPTNRATALRGLGMTSRPRDLGTLERLMERVQTRQMGQEPAREIDDWRTLQYAITTVRPLRAEGIEPGHGTTLTEGVRIEPHPTLRATAARLTSIPEASRALKAHARLPRLLYDDPTTVQPFEIAGTRAVGGALNVLELSGVNDPALVTSENPLTVTIPQLLAAGEHVLPVAFDGEFYLPLGRAEAVDGETRVILERLPQPTAEQTRSLGGSLRIVFQKVISQIFGTEYPYPILAAADLNEDLTVRYEPDRASVRKRVSTSNRIALFVHGIIGDTREMAASLSRAGVAKRYDLVLTFDYENLQDPISITACALKDRLAEVGLGDGHGKSLDIFAHSMGGLVTRWFVEREGGHQVVDRLVMLGTPNDGSPWPSVKSWATTALAIGLNELGKIFWPSTILAGLVKSTELLDATLVEMKPGSVFLRDLYASPDSKIPYVLIAGDTSQIPLVPEAEAMRSERLDRLLKRLWPDDAKYRAADFLFGGSNNDIAVSVESMRHLPERTGVLDIRPVACDHLSYFSNPASLAALRKTLSW